MMSCEYLFLMTVQILCMSSNNADPDQMQQNATSDKGQHGLPHIQHFSYTSTDTPQPLYNTVVGVHSKNRVS